MGLLKRSFDIAFALLLGLCLSPLFLLIAVAMKLTSPGPLLFRQERLAKNGGTFLMNKFRKFPSDWGSQGPGVTLHRDSRMTQIGQLLERTKLDELPQIWNILIGQMSFVGPRPESLRFRHLFAGEFAHVLNYTPGIFGPNQTKYRNESAMYPPGEDPEKFYEQVLFPAKAHADLSYFRNANFLSDLACIATGVFSLVFNVVIWRKSMRSSLALLVWDGLTIVAAWVATHWLKYSVVARPASKSEVAVLFKSGFIVAPLAMIIVFGLARVYRHPVRYFSETDFYRLVGACCAVWIASAITFGLLLNSTSSLLLAVSCLVSVFLMAVPRVAYRQWWSISRQGVRRCRSADQKNIVVCGISEQSLGLCNLLKVGFSRANLVGIVAEDDAQVRREIHGFEVVGQASDLDVLHTRYSLNQVWIGGELEPETLRRITAWCVANDVQKFSLNALPGFQSLVRLPEREPARSPVKGSSPGTSQSAAQPESKGSEVAA